MEQTVFSTKKLSGSKCIDLISQIQGILSNLQENNIKDTIEDLKSIDLPGNNCLTTFIRILMRYSVIFPDKVQQYVQLFIEFSKTSYVIEILKLNIMELLNLGADKFLNSLVENNLIESKLLEKSNEQLKVLKEMLVPKYCRDLNAILSKSKQRFPPFLKDRHNNSEDTERIRTIIINDNDAELRELISQPDFDRYITFDVRTEFPSINPSFPDLSHVNIANYAVLHSSYKCFKLLRDNGFSTVNSTFCAVINNNADIMFLFDPDHKPNYSDLECIIVKYRTNQFKQIVEHYPEIFDSKAYAFCCFKEFGEGLKKIIDFDPQESFVSSCRGGCTEIAKEILNIYDVNRSEGLIEAGKYNQREIIKFLYQLPDEGANYDIRNLIAACECGDIELVKILLSHSEIDINKIVGETFPLLSACAVGHVDVVKLLLEQPGILINQTSGLDDESRYYHFPLLAASAYGHYDIVELLLEQPGIDVNQEYGGHYPLVVAYENGYHDVGGLLYSKILKLCGVDDVTHLVPKRVI